MNRVRFLAASMLLAGTTAAFAQQPTTATASAATAVPPEAHQFDFMVGQWTIEARPKVSGLVALIHGQPKLSGTWKGARTADGLGIVDEVRIYDGSGNPITSNRVRRTYVKSEGRWKIAEDDQTRGRGGAATGHWTGGEMRLSGQFTEADGTLTLTRTRYFNITATGFTMLQDRSTDNGKSWEEASLVIDAKRIGAAR